MGDVLDDANDFLYDLEGLIEYARDNDWTLDMVLNGLNDIRRKLRCHVEKKIMSEYLTGCCKDEHSKE